MPPKLSTRFLVKSGDLPDVIDSVDLGDKKHEEFIRAIGYSDNNLFRKVFSLFCREPETDIGLGIMFMFGFVGDVYSGARDTIYAIALQQNTDVLDLSNITPRALESLTITQLVDYILNSPPRCAIILPINDGDRMNKVMKRLARTETSIIHRRVVFCMTKDEGLLYPGIPRLCFPGGIDDRISMLLYRVPSKFADPGGLRSVAEKLRDYSVFQPKLTCLLNMGGTLEEYVASLKFQILRRNSAVTDDILDEFPSFEIPWRKSLSENLQNTLVPTPDVTSSEIHRVLPVGVSKMEALRCFQSALPADLESPYVLTVESNASQDTCGSIALTQRTQRIVVNINCSVDPDIMSEVCRELRQGYRSVVQELVQTKSEISTKLENMGKKFTILQDDISVLKELVKATSGDRKRARDEEDVELQLNPTCARKTCMNMVTGHFASGVFKKQCASCIGHSNNAKKGHHVQT